MIYRQTTQQMLQQQQCNLINFGCIRLIESLLTADQSTEKDAKKVVATDLKTIIVKMFAYFNKSKTISLQQDQDGLNAQVTINIQSELGKLNLNSLYDFEKKEFMNTGKPNDSKKLCDWLFNKIAEITGKPSLAQSFEQHLKNRTADFNDVTELLAIKEFQEQFSNALFFDPSATQQKIFLTDIFTVNTQQEKINPLLFSPSWCVLLNLKPKESVSKEDIEKIFNIPSSSAAGNQNTTLLEQSLNLFYKKDAKDLPQEIKSILTTEYEANIFSLLLETRIIQSSSKIFTIVKMNTKQHLMTFDIVKNYQI